jgi:hypothetical protein
MGPRLRLPKYVHAFIDRHSRPRYYFRRPGFKGVPLTGLPWSPEFMEPYQAALGTERTEINAGSTAPGTINALVVSYYRSDAWNGLEEETRKTRRRIIEKFRANHGNKRVSLLQREHVEKMLAEIESPSALAQSYSWAYARGSSDHAQGQSDPRYSQHQASQKQRTPYLER